MSDWKYKDSELTRIKEVLLTKLTSPSCSLCSITPCFTTWNDFFIHCRNKHDLIHKEELVIRSALVYFSKGLYINGVKTLYTDKIGGIARLGCRLPRFIFPYPIPSCPTMKQCSSEEKRGPLHKPPLELPGFIPLKNSEQTDEKAEESHSTETDESKEERNNRKRKISHEDESIQLSYLSSTTDTNKYVLTRSSDTDKSDNKIQQPMPRAQMNQLSRNNSESSQQSSQHNMGQRLLSYYNTGGRRSTMRSLKMLPTLTNYAGDDPRFIVQPIPPAACDCKSEMSVIAERVNQLDEKSAELMNQLKELARVFDPSKINPANKNIHNHTTSGIITSRGLLPGCSSTVPLSFSSTKTSPYQIKNTKPTNASRGAEGAGFLATAVFGLKKKDAKVPMLKSPQQTDPIITRNIKQNIIEVDNKKEGEGEDDGEKEKEVDEEDVEGEEEEEEPERLFEHDIEEQRDSFKKIRESLISQPIEELADILEAEVMKEKSPITKKVDDLGDSSDDEEYQSIPPVLDAQT